jgi:hypothetical protein
MKLIVIIIFSLVCGCSSLEETTPTNKIHLTYKMHQHVPELSELIVDGKNIGFGKKAKASLLATVSKLPDGSTIYFSDPTNTIYMTSIVDTSTVISRSKRGSSESVFDMCVLPVYVPKLVDLIDEKQLNVIKE